MRTPSSSYLDRSSVERGKAFHAIAPLLWLQAGGTGPRIDSVTDGFAAPSGANYAVLFDVSQWGAFVETINDRNEIVSAFVVTDSSATFQQIANALPPTVRTRMLYEDYLSNFQINMGGSP